MFRILAAVLFFFVREGLSPRQALALTITFGLVGGAGKWLRLAAGSHDRQSLK